MLLIWYRHQSQPGPTELTEGTWVLSALGSAVSVDSTRFQLEASYWYNPQGLRAFKLKHGQWDRKYVSWEYENPIPTPQKREERNKAKQVKRGGRKIDISGNLRNGDTTTCLKELVLCNEHWIHTTTERDVGIQFHTTNPFHSSQDKGKTLGTFNIGWLNNFVYNIHVTRV